MMLRYELGLQATNAEISAGTIGDVRAQVMKRISPEAEYFSTENGVRTAYVFFDLDDPSTIPVIAEPLFQRLGAKVMFVPVMTADELNRGIAQLTSG